MHVLNNGSTIKSRNSFSKAFKEQAAKLGLRDISHMRVGRFSVTIMRNVMTQGRTLAVCELFSDSNHLTIERDSLFWECSKRDRLSQLAKIEEVLSTTHPLYAEVKGEIVRERLHFA